ncbi:MAG: helix-turn-helix domain-containing protein [Actinomycetota bacterium]|nr:helix-turn-helix domain-containing protein [Actinomycetota bacterium]
MIRIRASAEDLMQTRFAFSPLWEVVASFRALVDPSRHAIHLPWMVQARDKLRGLELGSLRALVRPEGYIPDFLTPPPTTPFPHFSAEIEALRRTPPERVREEVGRLVGQSSSSDRDRGLEAYLTDPSGSVERLAQTLVGYHERVIAPYWPRLNTLLEGDVLRRARTLAFEGPEALFAGLHRAVRYRRGTIEVDKRWEQEVDPDGRGVLLIPVAFSWPDLYVITDTFWQPTVVYSPRGVGTLWQSRQPPTGEALSAALGRGRASVLKSLAAPSTTTELARTLGSSPATVSQHLTRLRHAGLVEAHRRGRRVYYRLSANGESLLDLFDESGETWRLTDT